MGLAPALIWNADAVPVGGELVQREPLYDADEGGDVARELVEQWCESAGGRHRAGVPIEVEKSVRGPGWLGQVGHGGLIHC